ncbi:MAG: trypsin-like peptidase domain-containing protein [Actinobacteria bacterium]|nr:trypsin-like peptidase domain-containing protein [Actinomycetota bacterium]
MDDMNNSVSNSAINNSAVNKKEKKFFNVKNTIIALVIIVVFLLGSISSIGFISIINKTSPFNILNSSPRNEASAGVSTDNYINNSSTSEILKKESIETGMAIGSGTATLKAFDEAISQLAQKVMPSIVNIRVKVIQQDFFGNQQEQEGVGSGVIYSSDGYIITNNHVAGNAKEMFVTLSDGTEYPARLIGADANTDIAVIKIEAQNLKPAVFTSIEDVKVGEIAIALGSPFGLQKSVTMGVISALGREISVSADTLPMVDLIQTDATINPGNSGGPLVNSEGQVIGINTMIYSTSGSSAGVGFSIPTDTAANIASQIIKYGKARLPVMGIEMGDNTTDVKGVLIKTVTSRYPAEKAGIKPGDIITELNGKKIETQYELFAQILRQNVGDILSVKVYRQGSYLTFNVELVERPAPTSQ